MRFWIPLFALLSLSAWGQIKVVVFDRDLNAPLEGAQLKTSTGSAVTDAQGVAEITPPPGTSPWLLTVSLPGYQTVRVAVDRNKTSIKVELSLNGVVQGAELVVQSPKPQQTDAQPGVSQVVTGQQIQAQTMGIVEDAMSAIKTLPGVGYTGAFDSRPSIDGGDPNETVATLDGAYVLSPYQWLGAFTIFNPDMIDSIKLSTGIVGVPYGQVMSGLLEVHSKTPTDTEPHADIGLSTTGLDLFYQQAFGQNAGVLLGGKVTWMEVPLTLIGQRNLFSTDPYIRNGTAQFYWNPTPTAQWTLDGNIDTDGVASRGTNNFVFSLADAQVLTSSSLKMLLGPQLLWSTLVSYNSLDTAADFRGPNRDNSSYTQFGNIDTKEYRYQARSNWDWSPVEGQLVSWGVDEMWETWAKSQDSQSYPNSKNGDFTPEIINSSVSGKNTIETGLYTNYQFTLVPRTLTGEGGLRVDHAYVFGGGEALQTYPVIEPRLRLTWTFLKNAGGIQSMDVNGGSGLYSQFPADNQYLDTKYGVTSLDVGPSEAWFNVLGFDMNGIGGETLNVQTYYKTYLRRFYDTENALGDSVLKYDGTGYAYGFNLGAKKNTQFWDVSFTYTFDVTRLYNPGGPGLVATDSSSPLGVDYYPTYQVFHTMYFDFTWKPDDTFSLLTQGTAASGTPTESGGRTNWQYPIDIKLDWHGFYHDSKVRWEFYAGCQDVFALLYFVRPTSSATFSSGFPIPSVGYKLSF